MENENIILKLSFEFAWDILAFAEQWQECKKIAISKQILKSDTSVGANIREAQSAESKAGRHSKPFAHLHICTFSN